MRTVSFLILCLLAGGRALGDSVRQLTLEELIAQTPLIVIGTVDSIAFEDRLPAAFRSTEIRGFMKVLEVMKNTSTNSVTTGKTIPFAAHLKNHTLEGVRPAALPRVRVWFFSLPEEGRWSQGGVIETNLIPEIVAVLKKQERVQNGPANGSQPIRSETNRTSPAAGSRR